MSKDLALVNSKDLSLVEENSLNANQLKTLLKRTPKQYVKKRPAKGGGTWDYVTGGYVKKCLNLMFGWNWDFEIVDEKIMIEAKEVIVKGRLTCRSNGRTIVKMQYGNKDIIFKRQDVLDENGNPIYFTDKWGNNKKKTEPSNIPLSIGNDMKAAATDALKKCSAEIGIAADIYNKEDFREVKVDTEEYTLERLQELYNDLDSELLSPEDGLNIERIIDQKEEKSYKKAITLILKAKQNEQ